MKIPIRSRWGVDLLLSIESQRRNQIRIIDEGNRINSNPFDEKRFIDRQDLEKFMEEFYQKNDEPIFDKFISEFREATNQEELNNE